MGQEAPAWPEERGAEPVSPERSPVEPSAGVPSPAPAALEGADTEPAGPGPGPGARLAPAGGPVDTRAAQAETVEEGFRSEQLARVLADMAARAGFAAVVLSDRAGLPLASYGPEDATRILAALGSVLGETLEQVGRYLQTERGETVAVDVGYTDKLVLRRFEFEAGTFYVVVLCSQDVDERSELELSVEAIRRILERG